MAPETDPSIRMLSVAQVAAETGMSEYSIRQAIKKGELGHRRRGRCLYIPRHALDTYAKNIYSEPTAAEA